jgi:putative RNA 2'-phosphotransferase
MGASEAKLSDLSRAVSHALRHEPWRYELELDSEGWVAVEQLLESLRSERSEWNELEELDLRAMIEQSEKRRHEIRDGRIRACYGHSIPQRLSRTPSEPPSILFHGTSPLNIEVIRKQGLKPMNRQNVHLSVDESTAIEVGRRKSKDAIVLRVNAASAHEHGNSFYAGNEKVWLADSIPSEFIEF